MRRARTEGKRRMLISGALAAAAILAHPGYVPAKLYRFQEGDSFARVAQLNQTGYERLVAANPRLRAEAVRPGTVILVPARLRGEGFEGMMLVNQPVPPSPRPTAGGVYTVRNGDTDWSIARRVGIKPSELRKMNPGVDWRSIRPGHTIKVPSGGAAPAKPAARPQAKPVNGVATRFATVRSGDNDWVIASRVGIKPSELRALNPGVDWRSIWPGHQVKVPASARTQAAPTAAPMASSSSLPTISSRRVAVSRDDVNVRAGGRTDARVKGRVARGEMATVLDRVGDWYKLDFASGGTGWVRGDMIKPVRASEAARIASRPAPARTVVANGPRVIIAKDDVNVRAEGSTRGRVRTTVPKSANARVIARNGDWVELRFSSGLTGWVRSDMIKAASTAPVQRAPETRPTRVARASDPDRRGEDARRPAASGDAPRRTASVQEPRRSAPVASANRPRSPRVVNEEVSPRVVASSSGSKAGLVRTALSAMGTRYRWGGTSRSGFDCSGFTGYVFRQHGVSLPRTSIQQSRTGSSVSRGNLKEGDLLFFNTRGNRVSHVGIYIGGGRFVHASSGGGRVRTDSLSKSYYANRFAGARRVGGTLSTSRSSSTSSRSSRSRSSSARLPDPSQPARKAPALTRTEQAQAASEDRSAMERAERELESQPRQDRVQPGSTVSGG